MKITNLLYRLALRIDQKRMGLAEVLYRICMRNENLRDKCIIALTNIYEKLGRPREALDLLMRSDWTESYLLTYQLAYFRSEIGEIEVAI